MNDLIAEYQGMLNPSEALVKDIASLDGDILILGVGGKMGPALAKLARQAIERAGVHKKVIGASRFSESGLEMKLSQSGIETIGVDLLDDEQLQSLPDVKNILYLAGTKFGTTGKEPFTWAMNTYLPGRVAQKFKNSRIVIFSTGNVYPLSAVAGGGLTEDQPAGPLGEYAQSCLGRERLFQYYCSVQNTPSLIFRLNYANDVGYGVLLEIAKSVHEGRPIDLSMGHVNVIWQADANEFAIRCLHHCSVPSKILNITGPETIPIRWVAHEFAKALGREPVFIQKEQETALLNNAAESFRLFGYPGVTLKQMIAILGKWVKQGARTLNKPTHFQERTGQF